MNPERWQQIDRILDEALERNPEERGAFLAAACGADAALRREVELLLDHDERTNDFIDGPALVDAAAFLANSPLEIEPEKTIGPYKLLGSLGSGGMGDVYLAVDVRLGRKVALKLLRAEVTFNEDRLLRFHQEARAASALNHPNILTIYEIGEAGPIHFIATELVEGETIRSRINRSGMSLPEALDVSIQIAGALAAAHKAGIVHRDIKPENIMIREDGYAKLLDFGIAKLTEQPGNPDPDVATVPLVNTDTGIVIGTPNYMSPEQLRGFPVDSRTDVFSLGVTTYEMVTGRSPFNASTVGDLIVAVLEKDPPPISQFAPGAPEGLQRVMNMALRKNRDERYQTVSEMASDLKSLKRELEAHSSTASPTPPINVGTRVEATAGDARARSTVAYGNQTAGDADRTTTLAAAKQVSTGSVTTPRQSKRRYAIAGVAVVGIVLLVAAIVHFAGGRGGPINSLAILPFANDIADPNMEYLSDGLPESIIYSLSPLSSLKVMSFGSVLQYKKRQPDARQVSSDLGVGAVLIGRISQHGDTLEINAELVDARDNTVLWGGRYNRKLTEIVTVQEEIAREISEGLRLRLTSNQEKQIVKRYTDNTEAYQLYLQGRYYWSKRNAEAIRHAISYFKMATDKDPNYALAWAGLADSYATPSAELQPKDAMREAREAAERALTIDDTLAEAHASLAFVRYRYDWDWGGAEDEFRRSVELNPNYPVGHQWYGECLTDLGRFDEALAELGRAAALDPLSLIIKVDTATLYYYRGQYEPAIEQCQKALEMDNGFRLAHILLGRIYEEKHMDREAVEEALKARTLHGDNPDVLNALRDAFAARGLAGYFEKAADLAEKEAKKGPIGQFSIAGVYARLGRKDDALAALDLAYQQRDPTLVTLNVDPRLAGLHSHPRFSKLLQNIHLAQ